MPWILHFFFCFLMVEFVSKFLWRAFVWFRVIFKILFNNQRDFFFFSDNGSTALLSDRNGNCINVSISENCVASPTTTIMSPNDRLPRPVPLRPIAAKKEFNNVVIGGNSVCNSVNSIVGTPCQVAEITTSNLLQSNGGGGTMTPSPTPMMRYNKQDLPNSPTITPTTSGLPALIPISHHHHSAINTRHNVLGTGGKSTTFILLIYLIRNWEY